MARSILKEHSGPHALEAGRDTSCISSTHDTELELTEVATDGLSVALAAGSVDAGALAPERGRINATSRTSETAALAADSTRL